MLIEVKKHIYDYLKYDPKIEKECAENLKALYCNNYTFDYKKLIFTIKT